MWVVAATHIHLHPSVVAKDRWAVNYLRHECTAYDLRRYELGGHGQAHPAEAHTRGDIPGVPGAAGGGNEDGVTGLAVPPSGRGPGYLP